MDTVLAGQDPNTPAIDQATGQPLTIEELLRRRGLLAVGGSTRLNGQAPTGANPLAAAMASRSASGAPANPTVVPSNGAPVPPMASANGVDPSLDTGVVPNGVVGAPSMAASASGGMSLPDASSLAPLAVGGAAGLGYALAARRKKPSGAGPNAADFGGDARPSPKPGQMANGTGSRDLAVMPGTEPNVKTAVRQSGQISGTRQLPPAAINGEYSEVEHPLVKILTNRAVLKTLTHMK